MNSPYIRCRFFEGWSWNGNRHEEAQFLPQVPNIRGLAATQEAEAQSIQQTSTSSPTPVIASTHSSKSSSHPDSKRTLRRNSPPATMNAPEQELQNLIRQLRSQLAAHNYDSCSELLSRCKIALLNLKALIPTPQTPQRHLVLARESLELGALVSIHLKDAESFTRYFQQLQPFYALPEHVLPSAGDNASKITGLYLLLLLSQGDYAGFHTLLETLEMVEEQRNGNGYGGGAKRLEDDEFIQYPVRLEQALMEGSYDRIWGETKREAVPGGEFRIFSDVLIETIRIEIASCSEKSYASIPISNAKNLFFLDSEGAVVAFARDRGWTVRDGRIYFPQQEQDLLASEKDILSTSDQVIENTLGYARELETIV